MIPPDELHSRIDKLQKSMQQNDIGAALIIQRADLYYFSGTGQNALLLVPSNHDPFLIVKKSFPRAKQESTLENVIPYEGTDQLVKLLSESVLPGSRIGLESDVIPASLYLRYQKLFDGFSIADISKSIRLIRAVKSDYEIERLKEAALISKSVFNHARDVIREGLTEVELAAQLEMHARTLGHQGAVRMRGFNQELYFGHIMAGDNAAAVSFFDGPTGGSGLNPSYPQGAGSKSIKRSEPVLVDFVSVSEGYMVDQTRIFCLGEPPLYLKEAYQKAVHIKNHLADTGKPGLDAGILFDKAAEMAAEAGLANHFMGYVDRVNFVGHGVGLELDELPVIARGIKTPLEVGMVFALEPKFIFPGEGTVGIEDTFVVNTDQLQQLTDFSDELQII